MKNVTAAPGAILWLPDNAGTRAVIASKDHGALDHPVLVLSNPDVLAGSSQRGGANIQILTITSLRNTSLAIKFPGQDRRAVEKRREYLPLKRSPPEPHPDSGVLLEVRITGKATVTRERQSYVRLRVPLIVASENLVGLKKGTVKLEPSALDIVLDHLRRACPDVIVRTPVPAPPAYSHTDSYSSAPALEAAEHIDGRNDGHNDEDNGEHNDEDNGGHNDDSSKFSVKWLLKHGFYACCIVGMFLVGKFFF